VKPLLKNMRSPIVIPAQAGIQSVITNDADDVARQISWIPAFAGMTKPGQVI
jgi:hypothetical protein